MPTKKTTTTTGRSTTKGTPTKKSLLSKAPKKTTKPKATIVQDSKPRRMPPAGRKSNLSVKSLTPLPPEPEIGRKRKAAPSTDKLLDLETAPKDASSPGIKEGGQSHADIAKALGMDLPKHTPTTSTPIPRTDPTLVAQELANIEELASIKWSKYIPPKKVPHPKQIAGMMMVNDKEILYGGALGGGKSEWLAMEALRFCDLPGFAAIIFRRQLTDLSMPGALIDRIGNWLAPHKESGMCRYSGEQHTWSFRTFWPGTDIPGPEAKLQFGYIGGAEIRERYQSAEYQLCPIPETLVLMSDGTYKQIGNILVGDWVQTLQGPSIITRTNRRQAPCVQVTTPYGTQIHSTTHKVLSSTQMNLDGSTSMQFYAWQELSSQKPHKSRSLVTSLEMIEQDHSRTDEQPELRCLSLQSDSSFVPEVQENDSLASDDSHLVTQQQQELFVPLMLAVPLSPSTYSCSEQPDLSEDVLQHALSELAVLDCQKHYSSYTRPYDERAFSDQVVSVLDNPIQLNDVAAQNQCECSLDAKEHTHRCSQLLSAKYVHPYTKEICHHDQTISGHQLVSEVCSLKALEVSFEVVEITVANHSHYITSSKLVNMNCCFDELGQWPDDQDYVFMHTRIRKNVCDIHGKDKDDNPIYHPTCPQCRVLSQIPLRMRSASNPGMAWVKKRWGIKPDPLLYKTPRQALIAIDEGKKVKWVGTNPDAKFLPAYLWDNPSLNYKEYIKMLKELPEEKRSQLQDGNWEARCDSRFKRKWQQFVQLNLPEPYLTEKWDEDALKFFSGKNFREGSYDKVVMDHQGNILLQDSIPLKTLDRVFTTADIAVSVAAGPVDEQVKKKSSSTVISTWGITRWQELLWLHSVKIKAEIPDVVSTIIDLNTVWQPTMNKIEANGVGIGVAQYVERAGYPVSKNMKKTDKLENSLCAQIIMKNGRVLFPINALWLEDAEDDVFQWTGIPTEPDDRIDTLSDAANELGPQVAREISNRQATAQSRPRCIGTIGPIVRGPTNTFGKRFY